MLEILVYSQTENWMFGKKIFDKCMLPDRFDSRWPKTRTLNCINRIRYLFLIIGFFSVQVSSNEICDANSKKCAQVGSAAAWVLSIIETSKEPCIDNKVIGQWLKSNEWLTEQVKASEPEYAYLVKMQKRTYRDINKTDKLLQCSKIITLIKSASPLNSELR